MTASPVPPLGEWAGGSFGERGTCVLAPNPGPMTLDGTNTWVLREPGAERVVLVDPGPLDEAHLDAQLAACGGAGRVALVLVTHHHHDHTDAVDAIHARTGAPVRAVSPDWCRAADPLTDGEAIDVEGLSLSVVATPGHTADSVSFVVGGDKALLTGDMVLGRGTTVVVHPDGAIAPYLDSITRMRALVTAGEIEVAWPAHGPVLDDAGAVLDHYLTHRQQRLDQVRDALVALGEQPGPDAADHPTLARRVVEVVYADVDRSVWDAAEWSVRAQLAYLAPA